MIRILLVDDDQSFRPMLAETLSRLGHHVVTATNGDEALVLFREDAIDLVITDLIMPEREGLDVIRTLRRRAPNVKIIAMSGGGRTSPVTYLEIAKRLGAATVLAKPFSTEQLKSAIAEAVPSAQAVSNSAAPPSGPSV
jgi:CheY-like chemotaxis protein